MASRLVGCIHRIEATARTSGRTHSVLNRRSYRFCSPFAQITKLLNAGSGTIGRLVSNKLAYNTAAAKHQPDPSSMSPIRGDVKKKSPLALREGDDVVCIQPISVLESPWAWRAFADRPDSLRFVLDGFMAPWPFDAFCSESYASKRVGFYIEPTMVLFETPGLKLFLVMRGGIW